MRVRIAVLLSAAALSAAAQVILVTDPAGEGSASNPISLVASSLTPGPSPVTRTVSLAVSGAAGGTFLRQGQSGAWLISNWEQTTATTATVTLEANLSQARVGLNEGLLIMGYQTSSSLVSITLYVQLIIGTTTVNPTPLVVTPRLLSFAGSPLNSSIAAQGVAVTSANLSPVSFTVSTSTNNGVGWLSTSLPGTVLTTPANLVVTVTSQNLIASPFPYLGTVVITPVGGGAPTSITVSYTVTDTSPQIRASTRALVFNHQANTAVPAPRAVAITTSTGAAPLLYNLLSTTTSGGNWLLVETGGSTTPGSLLASLSPSVVNGLPPGTYGGQITVLAGGAENSPLQIPVTLNVSSAPQLTLSSNTPIVFNALAGGVTLPVQTLTVGSTGPESLRVDVSTQGASWLTASLNQNVTPATLTIGAVAAGYSVDGTFSGTVTVSSSTGSVSIPVTLNVSSQGQFVVNRSELNFSSALSTALPVSIDSTSASLGYSVATTIAGPLGGNWLQVSQTAGVTPGVLQVTANPGSLAAGVYHGLVTLSAAGANPVYLPVTFRVAAPLAISPQSLVFGVQQGQPLPAGQLVSVTSAVATVFTVSQSSPSGNLLDLSVTTGVTNTTLVIRPGPLASTLGVGSYRATVVVTPAGATTGLELPVVINVSPGVALSTTAVTLDFRGRERSGENPPAQSVPVTAAGGAAQAFSVAVSTDAGGNWLSATPTTATTPASVSVAVNLANLVSGSYTGLVTITAGAGSTSMLKVPVSLTVERAATPSINRVVHGATFAEGPLAPGLITAIFGVNLGPSTGLNAQVSAGRLTRNLGGVRVFFDGLEAPLLFVRADQINCLVPYALAGRAQASVQVENNGVLSNQVIQPVAGTAPGIFDLGGGQAAVLNQNGSINSASNPADRGTVAVVYLTGEGILTPPGVDGEVTTSVKRPVAPVSVRLGGVNVPDILFAGAAPGLAQGVLQINFLIPANVSAGANVPLEVTIGPLTSPSRSLALR